MSVRLSWDPHREKVGIIEYVYCQCGLLVSSVSDVHSRCLKNMHMNPLSIFLCQRWRMAMLPCFGLAKRGHLVERRDYTDQHSINQRLIYGLVGPEDAIINRSSKLFESFKLLEMH